MIENEGNAGPGASEAKAVIRAAALQRRAGVSSEVRRGLGERLLENGLRLAERMRPRAISAFYPIRDEPDTLPLLAALADAGYLTALPVTVGRGQPLRFQKWRPGDPTRRGAMKIPEPIENAAEVSPELLFVPLAAFDRRLHRIGFGAGHYDRTLSALRERGRVLAVGVAFSVSEIPLAPAEPHDERLDIVLTEREWIGVQEGAL